jgi:UrcA family protein
LKSKAHGFTKARFVPPLPPIHHTPHWETTMNISKYHNFRYQLAAIFCATFIAGLSLPANSTDLVGPDVTLRYENLAIETEQGAAQLLKRIEGAAGRVCARLDHGTLASRRNVQTCSRQLIADAVSKVNHPMLLAAYNSKGRVAPPVASVARDR